MIICVCNNVSEKKIRQSIAAGATTFSQLSSELEVGSCCGQCSGCVDAILDEELAVCKKNTRRTVSPITFLPYLGAQAA